MKEKAILPLNRARLTAGYKNEQYRRNMGFTHYGIDMADLKRSNKSVYAPFKMKIFAVGKDQLMGNTIIGISENPIEVHHGKMKGARYLVVRMAHLEKVFVKKGKVVHPEGNKIAEYGATGKYGGAPHLHIEIDTEIRFPAYSPTLAKSSNIWKAGTDTTINPMDVLKVDLKGERGIKQSFSHEKSSGDWLNNDDKTTLDMQGRIIKSKGV